MGREGKREEGGRRRKGEVREAKGRLKGFALVVVMMKMRFREGEMEGKWKGERRREREEEKK